MSKYRRTACPCTRALLDRSSGKGTFASHEELAARHRLLSSFSVGAVATTRTDLQFSRGWLTMPANEDLGNAAVQTASRGPTSMRATSCPSTSSATARTVAREGHSSRRVLTTTMAHYRTGGTPRFVVIGRRSLLRGALRLADRCPPA